MLACSIVIFSIIYQKRIRDKELLLEITIKKHELELLKKIVETQENEREKIAKDIHDDLGPRLTIIKLHLTAYIKEISDKKNKTITDTIQQVDEVISEMRTISQELSPSHVINYGLLKSLSHILSQISETTTIKCSFNSTIDENETFEKQLSINVYRLYTEIINNLLKHATPKSIDVEIHKHQNNLILEIKHDGIGLSDDDYFQLTQNSQGLGIKSIESRVFLLKGEIRFTKGEDSSTVLLTIPI